MKILFLLALLLGGPAFAQQPSSEGTEKLPKSPEINTALMETTFRIFGPSARAGEAGHVRFGTGFIILRPIAKDSDTGQFVLVTAKHVFEDINGDTATLLLRKDDASGNAQPLPIAVKIRDGGKQLFTAHPTEDVAAIDVNLPVESTVVKLGGTQITNVNWLATDDFLQNISLHPGDELSCLGFFDVSSNSADYPILRSGKIASYPILPLEKVGKILYDFHVGPGDSGGPVYFSFVGRPYKGTFQLGTLMTYQKILGIVIQEVNPVNGFDPSLGVIVPSVYIKETIDQLAGFTSTLRENIP